ncbi:unnamed protein product [Aureobasidium uvarum]|uniref:BZIP domain-containing protein n=1 Tax=Aureobasidium uvarum TaxID=2773716 RepID=A0A9N8PSQ9_9PEZI|nr:unnamed protein product [Aureobasidium uvarum]
MNTSKDEAALARRRAQNREAQRRFRQKQSEINNQNSATHARASQSQRPEAVRPSFQTTPPKTISTRTSSSLPSSHMPNNTGPCGLDIYGDINLLDFANLEGLLTPGPESEPTALPSPSQLSDILNMATFNSPEYQPSDHSRSNLSGITQTSTPISLLSYEIRSSKALSSGLNPSTIVRNTSFSTFGNNNDHQFHQSSPPPLVSSASSRESFAIEKPPTRCPEGNWVSALHIAVQKGHVRIVRVLLQHGVDCNQQDGEGLTPLIHSIISDHEDVLDLLIQNGARICETDNRQRNAVHWAVLQRREMLLKILLEHCSGDQMVIDGHDLHGKTPLHTAVDIGFEAGVRSLLESGANMNSWARKP